jgi:hypothetical protein
MWNGHFRIAARQRKGWVLAMLGRDRRCVTTRGSGRSHARRAQCTLAGSGGAGRVEHTKFSCEPNRRHPRLRPGRIHRTQMARATCSTQNHRGHVAEAGRGCLTALGNCQKALIPAALIGPGDLAVVADGASETEEVPGGTQCGELPVVIDEAVFPSALGAESGGLATVIEGDCKGLDGSARTRMAYASRRPGVCEW